MFSTILLFLSPVACRPIRSLMQYTLTAIRWVRSIRRFGMIVSGFSSVPLCSS